MKLTSEPIIIQKFTYLEYHVDGPSSSHGSSVSERAGLHANSDDKVTDQGGLARIRIRKRVDSIPVQLEQIEPGDDGPCSLEPGGCNGVVVDGASRADNLLRLGTYGDGPSRARLVDAGRTRPEEIGKGIRVKVVSEISKRPYKRPDIISLLSYDLSHYIRLK